MAGRNSIRVTSAVWLAVALMPGRCRSPTCARRRMRCQERGGGRGCQAPRQRRPLLRVEARAGRRASLRVARRRSSAAGDVRCRPSRHWKPAFDGDSCRWQVVDPGVRPTAFSPGRCCPRWQLRPAAITIRWPYATTGRCGAGGSGVHQGQSICRDSSNRPDRLRRTAAWPDRAPPYRSCDSRAWLNASGSSYCTQWPASSIRRISRRSQPSSTSCRR